jgi:hypothetical protein
VRGSDPPRCPIHSRQGAPYGVQGAPYGVQGAPDGPSSPPIPPRGGRLATIDDLIQDALAKQARLSALLDAWEPLAPDDPADAAALARLFGLHSQNAARLGRLLRDRRALSGESADGLLDALGKALDELSTELGVKL